MRKETVQAAYESLANAIIIQAAKDYKNALRKLKKRSTNQDAQIEKSKCESFFRSAWYQALTKVDPDFLMKKLKEEVGV